MWTDQDLELVETLARRVRLLSAEQRARLSWRSPGGKTCDRPRLRKLMAAGLLCRSVVNARPLAASRPLFRWKPGDDAPDCQRLAEAIAARWPLASWPVEVCWASPLAAQLFGSSAGRLSALEHRDHDLLLADAYVQYRIREPMLAKRWCGEDARPKAGYRIKDPDAFILGDGGAVVRVVESAGRYGRKQLEDFHEHCADAELPYEWW